MNKYRRALLGPAFPKITALDIQRRIVRLVKQQGERVKGEGMTETKELYKVPVGFKLSCRRCKKEIEPGTVVQVNDESGAILCLGCVVKRQNEQKRPGPSEFKAPTMPYDTRHYVDNIDN